MMKKFKTNYPYPLTIILLLTIVLTYSFFINSKDIEQQKSVGGVDLDEMSVFSGSNPKTELNEEQKVYFQDFKQISIQNKKLSLEVVAEYYDKIGPQALLQVIEEDKYCHGKGHNIGRIVYQKNQEINKAIEICKSKCTSGCFHGVLMEFFQNDSKNSMTEDQHVEVNQIQQKIKTICDQKVIKERIKKGGCIHGVGHALLFLSNYELKQALGLCNLFVDPGLIYYCATGVFMERSRIYGLDDNKVSKFYPCDQNNFPAACFRYKLAKMFRKDNYQKAGDYCLSIKDSSQRYGCFHGVGFGFFRNLDQGVATLDQLCSKGDQLDKRLCIEGAIGILSVYDKIKAERICNNQKENENICKDAIEVSNFGLSRDFKLYYN